jgi:hypothetical protein
MTQIYDWIMKEKIITTMMIYLLLFLLGYLAYLSIPYVGDDGPFEQCVESMIKKETGLDVDISPD